MTKAPWFQFHEFGVRGEEIAGATGDGNPFVALAGDDGNPRGGSDMNIDGVDDLGLFVPRADDTTSYANFGGYVVGEFVDFLI